MVYHAEHELRSAQPASQRDADMPWFQQPAGHLRH